jgi:putative salt-induced outer membrane protein YdiY
MKRITALIAAALSLTQAGAATLTLNDGSVLSGELVKIADGKVHFETAFAGVIEIDQSLVAELSSDAAVSLRTSDGEVFRGPVRSAGDGRIEVTSGSGTAATELTQVVSGWSVGERDPEIVAAEQAAEELRRKWAYNLAFDITGSDGNTSNFGMGLQFNAVLEGPQDRLRFYGIYRYQEDNDVRSKDEQIGGVRYTNFFTEKLGWFVRQELERDTFEGVDFRSTSAAGLTYRFFNEPRMSLEGSAGVSYRYEDYTDSALGSEDFPGLDFGLVYMWQFADWGRLNSALSYQPSFDDFGEYLLEHESSVDMPLGNSDFWVLRLGMSNKYNSEPGPGREDLDTTYFIRLLLSWE